MKNWFTMWFGRDMEVHGFELPDDATDEDRALAASVTREFPRLLVPASEAGTDYIERPVDDAAVTARLHAVKPASAWFDPGGKT